MIAWGYALTSRSRVKPCHPSTCPPSLDWCALCKQQGLQHALGSHYRAQAIHLLVDQGHLSQVVPREGDVTSPYSCLHYLFNKKVTRKEKRVGKGSVLISPWTRRWVPVEESIGPFDYGTEPI